MPDELTASATTTTANIVLTPEVIATQLLQATGLGFLVAAVYFLTQRKKRAEAASLVATLVLLTVLIAMLSQVIGNNLARAFSLVGALSIARFRTVVDDTRDTAFVIFAVIVGMAAGADRVNVALLGIPIVGAVALLLSFWGREPEIVKRAKLVIRIAIGQNPETLLADVFAKHLSEFKLTATETTKQGASLELSYAVLLKDTSTPVTLVTDLHKTEGVVGVEWSEPNGKK